MKKLFIGLWLLIAAINGFSTTYFVSNAGNDLNNGTSAATPWLTLGKVSGFLFAPGDIIQFRKGDTFTGTLSVNRAGNNANRITYTSYGAGAQPLFSGFTNVTGFTNISTNIWESSAVSTGLSTCNMVSINGTNTAMGRTPNYPNYFIYSAHAGSGASSTLTSSSLNSSVTNWAGAEAAFYSTTYIVNRFPITAASGTQITYNATSTVLFQVPSSYFVQNFIIQNDPRTLDVQNEWYYDPTTKKLRIFSTTVPTNVRISTTQQLVTWASFADFVTMSDLAFEGSNTNAITQGGLKNTTIDGCTFNYIGGTAIYGQPFGGLRTFINNRVTNCSFFQIQNMAIGQNEGYIITGNNIRNVGMLMGMNTPFTSSAISFQNDIATGIRVLEDSSIVTGNTIDSCGSMGIYWFGPRNHVNKNYVKNTCKLIGLKDLGGIYTWNGGNTAFTGAKVDSNIVINTGTGSSQGIYFDTKGNNTEVFGNTVAGDVEWCLLCGDQTYSINVHNNTFYDPSSTTSSSSTACMQIDARGNNPSNNFLVNDNIFFAKTSLEFCFWTLNTASPTMPVPFTSNNNYFARPINDNLTVQNYYTPNCPSCNAQRSLAMWQTFSGQDAASKKSPRTITNVNQLRFEYNATTSPTTFDLGSATYVDVTNLLYTGVVTLQPFTSLVLISSGTQATPTITWANPAAITYPAPLTATQLNATANTPGTFVYSPAIGTVLNAGTQTLMVTFTPTDAANWTTATKTVTIVVNKGAATLAYSNLTQTYTGSPLQPTITTTPPGLTVINTTYDGTGAMPVNAGSYAVVSGLTNANYSAPTISNTFVINKATATINLSNLNQVYNGTPRSVTASTSPVGLSGLVITYNGSSTVPTNAGSYAVVVTLTNPNYQATSASGTLVISKAQPTVTWANPTAITYGTLLSGTQLNATASVAGTFTYTPASGTLLNAGTQTLSVNFTPTDATNYNSVLNTTVTIVVNKATATISLSNLAQVYDGTGKSATVTTNPVGLNVITVTYDGSATLPINAGTYAVVASLNNPNYTATNGSGNLVISKATATLSLSNTSYTYDGTQKSVTVTTAPAGLTTVSVTYNGSGTPPTNVGSYAVIATLSNANYSGSTSGTLTISKATPNVSWNTPANITYPAPLSGVQLSAVASVPGSFVYTPAAGTVLNAGTYTLIADFTPTDGTNYNSVNGTSVILIVDKATATIILSNLAQDFDGNPKPVTVTTNPAGLGVLTITYDGSATVPSAIGSYAVNVTLSNTNYTATPATGTLVISATAANIFITNINQTYTGSPLPVTVTTSPPALAHTDTYNGSGTVPTNAGTYAVIATLNSPNVGADTATYIIAKANPVVTWSTPSPITYGTALNGTQLNAVASVPGVKTYTPPSGTVLNAGTQVLSVGFVPTDASNYNSIPATTVSIVVNKAVATISTSNTNQAFDGTQKSVTVTTSPVGLSTITTTYNGSTTPPSAVGTYQVISNLSNNNYSAVPDTVTLTISTTSAGISISNLLQTYTGSPLPVTVTTNPSGLSHADTYNGSLTVPTNVGSYTVIATLNDGIHTGADTQTLVIVKATPVIIWSDPSAISYGTALSSTQLNATTTVPGTFVYTPTTGAVLNVGTQSLSVVFTPTDAANYNSVTKIVSITVNKATASLSLGNLLQTYNGSPHPVLVTTIPAGLSGITVTYNGSPTPPTNAGSYPIVVTLVNDNYTATPINGTLVVSKAIPILGWVIPTQITQGTPLSSTQLNATSNIAGAFVYTPSFGVILNPGTTILSATFIPSDITNYSTAIITVPLSVSGSPFLNFSIIHKGEIYENLPFP